MIRISPENLIFNIIGFGFKGPDYKNIEVIKRISKKLYDKYGRLMGSDVMLGNSNLRKKYGIDCYNNNNNYHILLSIIKNKIPRNIEDKINNFNKKNLSKIGEYTKLLKRTLLEYHKNKKTTLKNYKKKDCNVTPIL